MTRACMRDFPNFQLEQPNLTLFEQNICELYDAENSVQLYYDDCNNAFVFMLLV